MNSKLYLHNTSIKSIFGITNLIYFRDIWKMHLLSSEEISFSMAICCKCLEHSVVFPVDLFWSNLHLMFCFCQYPSAEIPGYEAYSHPSSKLKLFYGRFESFLHSVNERHCKSLRFLVFPLFLKYFKLFYSFNIVHHTS